MRALALAAAIVTLTLPAFAASAETVRPGMVIVDASHNRLGNIDQVNTDGSVGVVMDADYAVIPAANVHMEDGRPVANLTHAQVEALVQTAN